MSINLPDHFVQTYSTNIELLLQQKGSRLRGLVTSGSHVGKQASPVNQVGKIEAKTPAGRFAPKARTDASLSRRWVFPIDKEIDQLIDSFDTLRLITDPKSAYVQNAAHAIGRVYDDQIIDSALGTAKTGETGTGSETFDTSAHGVAVDFSASVDVGLTVSKLIEARRIFRSVEVDLDNEPLTVVIGNNQEADLLNQLEVVSRDFQSKPVLENGRLVSFLGFNIIVSNRLDLVNTDERACFAFAKSGMYLGVWKDMNSRVSQRNDLSGEPWDLYTNTTSGATRLEAGKVVRILAQE